MSLQCCMCTHFLGISVALKHISLLHIFLLHMGTPYQGTYFRSFTTFSQLSHPYSVCHHLSALSLSVIERFVSFTCVPSCLPTCRSAGRSEHALVQRMAQAGLGQSEGMHSFLLFHPCWFSSSCLAVLFMQLTV